MTDAPDVPELELTPLTRALAAGDLDEAARLVAHGASVDAVGPEGIPPIVYVSSRPDEPVARLGWLRAHGARVDARVAPPGDDGFLAPGATAWHACAALGGFFIPEGLAVAAWLDAAGLDPRAVNADGESALHLAVSSHAWALIAELARLGCSVKAPTSAGETPLHILIRWTPRWLRRRGGVELAVEGIALLRRLGADVTAEDAAGTTVQASARALRLPNAIQDALGIKRSWLARLIR